MCFELNIKPQVLLCRMYSEFKAYIQFILIVNTYQTTYNEIALKAK